MRPWLKAMRDLLETAAATVAGEIESTVDDVRGRLEERSGPPQHRPARPGPVHRVATDGADTAAKRAQGDQAAAPSRAEGERAADARPDEADERSAEVARANQRALAAVGDRAQRKQELVRLILEQTAAPIDAWEVAATLEGRGFRDLDAAERFGKRDVFDLADELYASCRDRIAKDPPAPRASTRAERGRIQRFAKLYFQGAFFFVPLSIQLASLLVLGYSQWASLDFTTTDASIVAIAVIVSFVVTGGFVQALGYIGPQFIEPGKHLLTEKMIVRALLLGMAVAFAVGALLAVTSLLTDAFETTLLADGLAYYVLLSLLWLSTAVLYMMRRYLAMVASTIAGIGAIALVKESSSIEISAAHWIALGVSSAVALSWAGAVLRRERRGMPQEMRLATMPRPTLLIYAAAPYFVYGTLYFGFLFADRLISWSAGAHPLPIWFSTPYELGLDWALLAVIFALAFLEYTVHAFSTQIIPLQERSSAFRARAHNHALLRFYLKHLIIVGALIAAGAIAVFELGLWLRHLGELEEVRDLFTDKVARKVYWWGVAGYGLLVWGLLNGLFLFSLARPWPVLRALVPAIAAGTAVGLYLSRTGDYHDGVIGLAAGSLVFTAITTWSAIRMLRRADYYYYAAY